ncbi:MULTISPECIES: integrase core domain-containing protein [unclassified Labrenzia]|uniref:integrase core domain-containing protein n=1 Tax=unclassified Labrenzia TaxID=2648686 RepID=UPI0012693913
MCWQDGACNEPAFRAFVALAEAGSQITAWKEDYNRNRPHLSLGNLTPTNSHRK